MSWAGPITTEKQRKLACDKLCLVGTQQRSSLTVPGWIDGRGKYSINTFSLPLHPPNRNNSDALEGEKLQHSGGTMADCIRSDGIPFVSNQAGYYHSIYFQRLQEIYHSRLIQVSRPLHFRMNKGTEGSPKAPFIISNIHLEMR